MLPAPRYQPPGPRQETSRQFLLPKPATVSSHTSNCPNAQTLLASPVLCFRRGRIALWRHGGRLLHKRKPPIWQQKSQESRVQGCRGARVRSTQVCYREKISGNQLVGKLKTRESNPVQSAKQATNPFSFNHLHFHSSCGSTPSHQNSYTMLSIANSRFHRACGGG